MILGFKNRMNIFDNISSGYDSPSDALYEYMKNLEEQKSKTINLDFDYSKKQVVISGDGKSVDEKELREIANSIGESSKDTKHFGVGLFAFLKFSNKLSFLSKKKGHIYLFEVYPSHDRKNLVCDIKQMERGEQSDYKIACDRLRHWDQGSAYVFDSVGNKTSNLYNVKFDIKNEFEEKRFIKWLQEKNPYNLKRFVYKARFGNGKQKKLVAKLGKGKALNFSLPSKTHCIDNVFQEGERFFELKMNFDLWIGSSHKDTIKICEDGQNALDLTEQCKKLGIGISSVYRNSDLARFLTGVVDFKIKSIDKGIPLNVYDGSRSKLVITNMFGAKLMEMLTFANELIKPVVEEYKETNTFKKDERRSNEINNILSAFFKENNFDDYLKTQSDDEVFKRIVKCPDCGIEKEPTIKAYSMYAELSDEEKRGEIFDIGLKYKCHNCGKSWKKQKTKPRTRSNDRKPIYDKSKTKPGKERVRVRGYGYSVSIQPFEKDDLRRYRYFGTQIEINSRHKDYIKLDERTKKTHSMPNCIKPYEYRLALTAICDDWMKDQTTSDAMEIHDMLMSRFEVWYYTEMKGKGDGVGEVFGNESDIKKQKEKINGKENKNKSSHTAEDLKKKFSKVTV